MQPILIIGGGPSGLAAALTLTQNKIPVRIIDKAMSFHQQSRGAGLQPRTMEVFRFLGILDDARRHARKRVLTRAFKLPNTTEPARTWSMHEKFERTPDRPEDGQTMSQYITEGIFRDHLAKSGVHVELNTEPVSLEQDADGVAVVVKKVSADGLEATETIRTPYVIGADGAKGFTRRTIGSVFEGETKEEDGQVWADVEIEGIDSEFWYIFSEPEAFTISIRPKDVPDKFHVGVGGKHFDTTHLLDEQRFASFIKEKIGRPELVFKNFTSMTYWKPKIMMINKFWNGRVFIVGDAAHIHSPTGGQGLNTSVQDSFNLGWKLALVYKGLAPPTLLSTYEIERRPVVALMLAATSNLYQHIVLKKDQDLNAAPQDKSTFFQWRNLALRQYEINYRWSPLVYDVRPGLGLPEDELKAHAYEGYPGENPRAGDRAPDAPTLVGTDGVETTLFSILKPYYHTVLVFSPDGADVAGIVKAVAAYPEGLVRTVILGPNGVPATVAGADVYHDKEGHAHKAYHVAGDELVVVAVRPDGYVGGFVDSVEGLQTYFSHIFES